MASLSLTGFINERAVTGNPLLCNRLFRDRVCKAKSLYNRNLVGHFGCVNAIEFSNKGGQFLASGGDDRRILLWNIQEALSLDSRFEVMKGEHHSNVFSLAFDSQNTKLYSGGNDDQVLVHDIERKETLNVFLHEDAVYGLAVDPRDSHIFTSACADGRILQWDTRVPSHQEPLVIANYQTAFYAVVHHPMEPQFLATANSKEGVALWDVRAPRSCLMRYGSAYTQQNAMSVRFNQLGTRLVALRRRLPPVVYNIQSSAAAIQFNHSGYYNSCTMKSCTFAGDRDQYVLSGSDDFSLYMWEVPEASEDVTWVGEAKLVLQGHRSIVNQVRFNTCTHNIVSSGVEKIIKLWSPFDFPNTENDENPRQMFSHQQYIDLVINSGTALSHDYADQSMEEDPRMIAFFDSLVQREINRSFSDSDDSEMSPESLYLHFAGEDDSEDGRDSNSGSSVASFRANVVRMAAGNDDTSPTSQLRTLWNLTSATRASAHEVLELTESSSDHDDSEVQTSKSELIEKSSATHSYSGLRENCSTFADEIAGTSRVGEPVENGAAHKKTQKGSEGTSSKRKHRPVPSSSTSPGSSSSDEDMNFQELRAKSRMLRRFVKKKKRKAGTDSDESLPSSGQKEVNTDRFINLQQRIAISKVLRGKIRQPGDRVVRSGGNEGDMTRINEHLQQRAMATQQRLAISRIRQRLQQENILSLGDAQTEVRESNNISQDHQDVSIRTLPAGSVAPSCSTMPNQRTTDGDHASVHTPLQSSVHNSNSPANVTLDSNPSSSFHGTERQDESSNVLSLLNSNDDSTQTPSCSGEMSQVRAMTGNHVEDLPKDDVEGQHSNKFHKFKNQSKRSQRKYRSNSVKKNKDHSGTE
ncbi:DDB1- and CUL4-associated factor 5-like [Asterias rubens]|uniref:DDB1- and CUL4-associated factor 5-like n=1 Tax=Asterias rubens TaxID=7604 RepID=UPI001454F023|nr:DDB1- and CUL4-associated factor 5-like [Asterias rubens]